MNETPSTCSRTETLAREAGSAILAGASIGIAATVYLKVSGLPGAFLFGFGLMAVITLGFNLFTGKAQYVFGRKGSLWLAMMLVYNLIGTYIVALLTDTPALSEASQAILDIRTSQGWLKCGLLAIPCGFIMTTAVRGALGGNWWPLILGVPTFILCGFPHCIADSFYVWCAPDPLEFISQCYIPAVAGNYIGCNLYRMAPVKSFH